MRIRNGRVPCVHIDTIKPASCTFKHSSGRWLESKAGQRFALVGESISQDGGRGGPYVVAAPVGDKAHLCAESFQSATP